MTSIVGLAVVRINASPILFQGAPGRLRAGDPAVVSLCVLVLAALAPFVLWKLPAWQGDRSSGAPLMGATFRGALLLLADITEAHDLDPREVAPAMEDTTTILPPEVRGARCEVHARLGDSLMDETFTPGF